MFSTCTVRLATKRLLIFTNNDNPHADAASKACHWGIFDTCQFHSPQVRTYQKAEDLKGLGIDIDLLNMAKPGQVFSSQFFGPIVSLEVRMCCLNSHISYQSPMLAQDTAGVFPDSAANFESLMNRVRAKTYRRRNLMKIPLTLYAFDN